MSLLVDPRAGSGDLVAPLRTLGCPAELSRLDFGDLALVGNGPRGPHLVGIEVKTIADLLQCMTTGRFAAHQLPGLVESYDTAWLLIEGQWRANREGVLEVRVSPRRIVDPKSPRTKPRWKWSPEFWVTPKGRRWMWRDVHGWLQTVGYQTGVLVGLAADRQMTARFCASVYHWWTDKGYLEHKALKTFQDYKSTVTTAPGTRVSVVAPDVTRRVAKELPGLGWERSEAAARHFRTVAGMVAADEKEWQKVEGVGKVTAERIVRAIREGKE